MLMLEDLGKFEFLAHIVEELSMPCLGRRNPNVCLIEIFELNC